MQACIASLFSISTPKHSSPSWPMNMRRCVLVSINHMALMTEQMVAFVAPWCGHCKNLGPEYTAAAQSLSPLIPFYAVDCDESSNRGLCAEYGVQGYPTIKGFPKAGKGAAKEYNGERKRGALVEYAKGLVPERVKKLRVQGDIQSDVQGFWGRYVLINHVYSPKAYGVNRNLSFRMSFSSTLRRLLFLSYGKFSLTVSPTK